MVRHVTQSGKLFIVRFFWIGQAWIRDSFSSCDISKASYMLNRLGTFTRPPKHWNKRIFCGYPLLWGFTLITVRGIRREFYHVVAIQPVGRSLVPLIFTSHPIHLVTTSMPGSGTSKLKMKEFSSLTMSRGNIGSSDSSTTRAVLSLIAEIQICSPRK